MIYSVTYICRKCKTEKPLSVNPSKGNRSFTDYRTKKQKQQILELFQLKLF